MADCTACGDPLTLSFDGKCEGCHNSRAQPRRGRTPRDPKGRAIRVHVGLSHDANAELTKRAAAAGKSLSLTAARILEAELVPCPTA